MPDLTPEERNSINRRLALQEAIRAQFENRLYTTQCCSLCDWASNGLTLDEAIAANRRHIQEMHAREDAQMKATFISMDELLRSFHDHDCEMAFCACKCGCTGGPFCITVLGALCSTCTVHHGRGDSAHGVSDWEKIEILVPGDGSEHLDYIRDNVEHIPDFLWNSVAQVMDMAEQWIKERNAAP